METSIPIPANSPRATHQPNELSQTLTKAGFLTYQTIGQQKFYFKIPDPIELGINKQLHSRLKNSFSVPLTLEKLDNQLWICLITDHIKNQAEVADKIVDISSSFFDNQIKFYAFR